MNESRNNEEKGEDRKAKWGAILEGWEASDLSQTEYCRNHGISLNSFFYWRKRLKSPQDSGGKVRFVKLSACRGMVIGASGTGKDKILNQYSIRFWVKDFCVEIGENFARETLSQLVETLRRI